MKSPESRGPNANQCIRISKPGVLLMAKKERRTISGAPLRAKF